MRNYIKYEDLEIGMTLQTRTGHVWRVVKLFPDIKHVTIRHLDSGREEMLSRYKFHLMRMVEA